MFHSVLAQTGLEFTRSCFPNVSGIRGVIATPTYLPTVLVSGLSWPLPGFLPGFCTSIFLLGPFGFSTYRFSMLCQLNGREYTPSNVRNGS